MDTEKKVVLTPRAIQLEFFASRADLCPGVREAEKARPIKYIRRGLFPTPAIARYGMITDLPDLDQSARGDVNHVAHYLVIDSELDVVLRPVPQSRGGVLYAIDEVANPTAMIIVPGGRYGDACLIVGLLMATSDPRSHVHFRRFKAAMFKGFRKIGGYYVGPEALRLFEAGFRLTHSTDAPRDYDFQIA